MNKVTNIVFAGLGGQGIIKAADILAEAATASGFDVKQSEVHGMSQRGGSVSSDVRYGEKVYSPMVPPGGADFLIIMDATQVDNFRHRMKEDGLLIEPALLLGDEYEEIEDLDDDDDTPLTRRNFNIAMLGALSAHLDIEDAVWTEAIKANLPAKAHAENFEVFALGRKKAKEE